MPSPFAPKIVLEPQEKEQLEALLRAGSTPQALVRRVRIVLRLGRGDDPSNVRASGELGINRQTVALWRVRFAEGRLAGLQDAPRPGRPPVISPLGPDPRPGGGHGLAGGPRPDGHPMEPR